MKLVGKMRVGEMKCKQSWEPPVPFDFCYKKISYNDVISLSAVIVKHNDLRLTSKSRQTLDCV